MKGIVCLAVAVLTALVLGQPAAADSRGKNCRLGNGIEHIVYIQFDNVHLRRDNPNDLEQIPNLLNFLEGEGTLFTNHHTPLISHTSVKYHYLTDRRLRGQIRGLDWQ